MFWASAALAALTFFLIGVARGRIIDRNLVWNGVETLLVGGLAVASAFAVGAMLKGIVSG